MSKSPKDTKGPIVASGPTKGQNRSRNSDGRWRAKRSDTGKPRLSRDIVDKSPPPHTQNLSLWFWGGIIAMAVLSILLTIAAGRNSGDDPDSNRLIKTSEARISPDDTLEVSGFELDIWLTEAKEVAFRKVMSEIEPLLDAAYFPVYAAVPYYADFHYSVVGEYAELFENAFGNSAAKLQETLFSGLEARLHSVSIELDEIFNSAFQEEIEAGFSANGRTDIDIGPVTRKAVQDSVSRMWLTAPVGTVAAFGTGAGIKIAASTIAKQMSAKLAAKALAKTGKLAATGTAAGSGAVLCSWAGPGAVVCAAAGGVGAWFAVDYGMIWFDESRNRDTFEANLKSMIDNMKAHHKNALEQAIIARSIAISETFDEIIHQQDFTLRELSGALNPETCGLAKDFAEKYDSMREHLRARNSEAISALQKDIVAYAGNISIGSMVREIQKNIVDASKVTLHNPRILGNLPAEHRSDRDLSIQLRMNGMQLETNRATASTSDGFSIVFEGVNSVLVDQALTYAVAIEQPLRLWRTRYFGGSGEVILIDHIAGLDGLVHTIRLEFSIVADPDASAIEDVSISSEDGENIILEVEMRAEPLAELMRIPAC